MGKFGSVSCGVTPPFPWVLVHTSFCLCPPRVCFSSLVYVLVALWWVNCNLHQEGLCHTQVYCIQSPCSHSSPVLTHISSGDTQTQFCLSLCVVSGSWCAQDMFEPSECLWWVWGLIQNVISPLQPSYLGFSFALDVGYLLKVSLAPCSHAERE